MKITTEYIGKHLKRAIENLNIAEVNIIETENLSIEIAMLKDCKRKINAILDLHFNDKERKKQFENKFKTNGNATANN
jgi:hypothetical protein